MPTITLTGVEQAIANLGNLPRKVAHRHLRIALSAAGGTIKAAAVAKAPAETKLLRKSLGVKVKIPDASFNVRHHGRPAYVVIGPRRQFVGPAIRKGGRTKILSTKRAVKHVLGGGKVQVRRASRYAHLAEKASPYLAPASRSAGPAASARAAEKLAKAFETEAAAMPK